MVLVRVIFRVYIFFSTQNMNTRSILKPEVELMLFLRTRNQKNHEKRRKCHKNGACTRNIPCVYIFRHGKYEPEVHFEPVSRINGVSVHAQ